MKGIRLLFLITIIALIAIPGVVLAQTYLFNVDEFSVDVFWNKDGTASILYNFTFTSAPSFSPIDFVDVGLPNDNFEVGSISAEANGNALSYISRSEYQGSGSGVAIGLGEHTIRPGETGTVQVLIRTQRDVLYPDTEGDDYASGVFVPTWFGSQSVKGDTRMCVTFHLPPGVAPEDPRWHAAPTDWPSEPETAIDDQGRVTYTWRNDRAKADEQYKFGASFPAQLVPVSAISRPSFWETIGIDPNNLVWFTLFVGFIAIVVLIVRDFRKGPQQRKLQYLPPKIAIEGHGIKRGLTAVEAAILLQQPVDKVLTMILFAVIKKEAASVTKKDPLTLEIVEPTPEGLREYEKKFLAAFDMPANLYRQRYLEKMMISLVKSVALKMKGFGRRESVSYYKGIVKRAWAQVEAAETPEVRSEKYNEMMEWTMLDKEYDERTRDVFRTGPAYVPEWWPRYDPAYRLVAHGPPVVSAPSGPSTSGIKVSMPHLPGSDFAASVVTGVQNMSSGVIGNLTDFTSGVTSFTNPVPKTSSSSFGVSTGGSGVSTGGLCACACACAGCACACAGGGR